MTDESSRPADLTPSLVVRLRQGDSTAAEMLRSIHGPAILRFCMGYLANEVEAQDAVQEVFVLTLRSDVVPENFRAWLYRVARNHCLKVLRTRRRKPPPGELPPESLLGDDITGNLTRMARDELKQRLNTLVASLPEAQSEVLRLRYSEGLSRVEIADVLEIPESVVKSRLYEAMKKLREHPSLLAHE
ncbi:MAG: sigma-70 family RNA polymerase sigma factor [Planctomycetota bacterium]